MMIKKNLSLGKCFKELWLNRNICCPIMVEWTQNTLSVWKVTSPVVVLPGAQGNLWSSRKIKPGWRLWCGASMPVKHSELFASDKQSSRLLTKDAARTDIPVCFRSSTQAQSQGFSPFQRVEKSYNITSFGVREMPGWRDSFRRFLI